LISDRVLTLGSTHFLTAMTNSGISWGLKAAGAED